MNWKNILGWVLAVLSTVTFFSGLIILAGFKAVLYAMTFAIVCTLLLCLCMWLIHSK